MNKLEKTERNNEMLRLRIEGHSMNEIAKMFGITKQRVFMLTNGLVPKEEFERARQQQQDIERIKFQGIYEMFKNDYRLTFKRFQRIASNSKETDNNIAERWRRFLLGECKSMDIRVSWINNLIEYSGMTYEYLFKPREVTDNERI